MGFTTDILGLVDVTSKFGKLRKGCPHKGTDFGSARRPMEFKAGIYGKVIGTNWNYGTITVTPFHSPDCRVQYLHCSEFRVTEGDLVQPWTIIGVTGDTAPPGTDITGVHLHLQVETPGQPTNLCWGDRNFTDPEKWNITNPLIGEWRVTTSNTTLSHQIVEETMLLRVLGDEVGAQLSCIRDKQVQHTRSDGQICIIKINQHWPNIQILERKHNTLKINVEQGNASWTSSSNKLCILTNLKAVASVSEIRLISQDQLEIDGRIVLKKVGLKEIVTERNIFEPKTLRKNTLTSNLAQGVFLS